MTRAEEIALFTPDLAFRPFSPLITANDFVKCETRELRCAMNAHVFNGSRESLTERCVCGKICWGEASIVGGYWQSNPPAKNLLEKP